LREALPMIKYILLALSCIFFSGFSFALSSSDGIQIYQKNVHLSPEHKQKLADDITRYRNAENLWDVLREEFSLSHYEESYAVQAKIEWFMNNQDFLLRTASRAAPYLYYISQQVKKRHLPAELVLLPIVESGYNPFSVSSVGASGIWQLMPDTATGLGIKRDWWYDGRRDVIASTNAALSYLAYLQSFFEGNWLLALAAYNTGEGNVLAAIKRNIREGRDTDFWSLPVAQQTRDYVPSLLALAVIISHPDKYPVYLPPVRNAPYLAQIDIGVQINLKYAAMLAGISNKKLLQLNPGFKGPSTSNQGAYKLVLPIENVEQFTENLARSPLKQRINWVHYKVKTGDTLLSIAKKFGTPSLDIRKMNHLSKNNLHPGTNLLIPPSGAANEIDEIDDENSIKVASIETDSNEDSSNKSAARKLATTNNINNLDDSDNINTPEITKVAIKKIAKNIRKQENKNIKTLASFIKKNRIEQVEKNSGDYILKPGDTVYMVRSQDTIEKIAQRFHITAKSLRAANQVYGNKLPAGIHLIIPTHLNLASNKTTNQTSNKNSSSNRFEEPRNVMPSDTVYMVRRGDTIEKIARKFRTSAATIRVANLIDNNSLVEGESIVIPAHLRG
jgi:membrane-bound lytic murein transglycosylase D